MAGQYSFRIFSWQDKEFISSKKKKDKEFIVSEKKLLEIEKAVKRNKCENSQN